MPFWTFEGCGQSATFCGCPQIYSRCTPFEIEIFESLGLFLGLIYGPGPDSGPVYMKPPVPGKTQEGQKMPGLGLWVQENPSFFTTAIF